MPTISQFRRVLPVLALALALALAARADAQSVAIDKGTLFRSSLPTASFGTTGALMNGMRVTAHFGDLIERATWGPLTRTVSGVLTPRFALFHQSSLATALGTSWNLANFGTDRSLTRLVLSGAPGRTVFDLALFGADRVGTPGSETGLTLEIAPLDLPPDVLRASRVTYRNLVAVAGAAPVGDLYEEVDLDLSTGLPPGRPLAFNLDTDNLPADATIVPVDGSVVPEPSTYALMATGLAGMFAIARRRPRT